MRRTCKLLSLAVVLLVTARGAGADVEVGAPDSQHDVKVKITNEIKMQDVAVIAQVGNNLADVTLDSNGGDVDAAIAIGRIIREQQAFVGVAKKARCLSSCSLVYISGVVRANQGIVGVHRPYLAGSPLEGNNVRKAVPTMLLNIKNYVAEMGITDEFYNILVNTESDKMRAYAGSDIEALVPTYDPVWDELLAARRARGIGITTAEYRKRYAEGEQRCSGPSAAEWMSCRSAILWGLSEPLYEERDKEAMDKCRFTEEDLDAFYREPRSRREDLPLFIKNENCYRAILLGR